MMKQFLAKGQSAFGGSQVSIKLGFTLIEILVVVSLLGIVMISITQFLAGVLTGSAKANASQMVKENGQFAISTIERSLRNSTSVASCNSDLNFSVIDRTGVTTAYNYSIVSDRLQQIQTVNAVATRSYLTNAELKVEAFSCLQFAGAPGQPAVYKILLTISKPSALKEKNIVSQTFETTVSLRTY